MTLKFTKNPGSAIPLHLVRKDELKSLKPRLTEMQAAFVDAVEFNANAGEVVVIPDAGGSVSVAVAGLGTDTDRKRGRFLLASVRSKLPKGTYQLATSLTGPELEEEHEDSESDTLPLSEMGTLWVHCGLPLPAAVAAREGNGKAHEGKGSGGGMIATPSVTPATPPAMSGRSRSRARTRDVRLVVVHSGHIELD